jgi:hypothetical protein
LRDKVLTWLAKHPEPAVLAEVVKLWAAETSITSPNEPRYRQIVERVSGMKWDRALLQSLNTKAFFAKGSALEILSGRIPQTQLCGRVVGVKPASDAMAALHNFIGWFDYMPSNRAELLGTVWIHKAHRSALTETAKLSRKWYADYGHQFNIRDFHLTSHLARDPLRVILSRTQLMLELGQAVSGRQHARAANLTPGKTDRYWHQAQSLSIVDLWNLYLLNEMLQRPRIQMQMRISARYDRVDRGVALGGLVFYGSGKAEPVLDRPDEQPKGNDLRYLPSRQMVRRGRDALCRFHAHFEKIDNAGRAGPTMQELRQGKGENFYGLVLTSVSENAFSAHYYNPQGVVVSLGKFPLLR